MRFRNKLYRQNVSIPMGLNCNPLAADLFLLVVAPNKIPCLILEINMPKFIVLFNFSLLIPLTLKN